MDGLISRRNKRDGSGHLCCVTGHHQPIPSNVLVLSLYCICFYQGSNFACFNKPPNIECFPVFLNKSHYYLPNQSSIFPQRQISRRGTAHPSGAPAFTHGFQWGTCYSIFSFMCMFCRSLFFPFVLFLLTIVLSVLLRFMDSGYTFGIFILFLVDYKVMTPVVVILIS